MKQTLFHEQGGAPVFFVLICFRDLPLPPFIFFRNCVTIKLSISSLMPHTQFGGVPIMKTEDWQILFTLYEAKNLTQTAKLLFLSQPALTKRLQTIEQELGAVIAIRTNKGIAFTPAGEYLAAQAGQFLKLTYETKQHLKSLIQDNFGQIKIGAPSSFTKHYLPGIIHGFNLRNPGFHMSRHRITEKFPD